MSISHYDKVIPFIKKRKKNMHFDQDSEMAHNQCRTFSHYIVLNNKFFFPRTKKGERKTQGEGGYGSILMKDQRTC